MFTFAGFVRDPSGRNMRHMLASVILRLLGSRVVHEDADLFFYPMQNSQSKREVESPLEAVSVDLSGDSLFDRLLLVLHGLLSSCQPSWLKSRPACNSTNESSKDSAGFDREVGRAFLATGERDQVVESLQVCSLNSILFQLIVFSFDEYVSTDNILFLPNVHI